MRLDRLEGGKPPPKKHLGKEEEILTAQGACSVQYQAGARIYVGNTYRELKTGLGLTRGWRLLDEGGLDRQEGSIERPNGGKIGRDTSPSGN